MDTSLDTLTRELTIEENSENNRDELEDCSAHEDNSVARELEKYNEFELDVLLTGSSDNDESNGFQKIKLVVGCVDTPDTEPNESNGFQKVNVSIDSTDSAGTELDESNGFQKVNLSVGVRQTPDSEVNEIDGFQNWQQIVDNINAKVAEIEDKDGFHKVNLTISSSDTLNVEVEESSGFHTVQVGDSYMGSLQQELEDIEDDSGFQNSTMKDSNINAVDPEEKEDSEKVVHEINYQKGKKSIRSCDTPAQRDNREAESMDVLTGQCEENILSSSCAAGPSVRRISDGSVLRHRIAPEPARNIDKNSGHTSKDTEDEIIPRGSKEKRKIALIRAALESEPIDIETLRKLAISPGGLVNKNMRQRVWPLLINANTTNITPKPSQEEMEALTKTYNQVVMDVNRSSSRFPPGIDDHVRMSMKDKLVDLIMRVMIKHPDLKYYQGFHDVCITFLLCMDEDIAFAMVDKLAMGYMREYLDETMERTSLLLNFIYPLVNKCNPELCAHMERNDLGTIFALSWVITWFSHVLGDIKRILRVFDFFLASHRMMPVYLSAAFVLYRERDIYTAGDEMGYIHKCLSTIPSDLPMESLLQRAGDIYLQYPPTEISNDPMLIHMNRQVYAHFTNFDNRNAARQRALQTQDRGRVFVKATMWTVTAVVGVAVAVLYHSYMGRSWNLSDIWSTFS